MDIKNLIYAKTDEKIFSILKNEQITFYIGIDPTADSMHLGHLGSFVMAQRLINQGHKCIIVIGGMTGLIGDPSGKKKERKLISFKIINDNIKALSLQIKQIFSKNVVIKNNIDWLDIKMSIFLREYGKLFNVNNMLAKDSVVSRLNKGISFTEFTYQILQAMDFAYLFKSENCILQIGGQDQWGNITSGLDFIRKINLSDKKAYGLTVPLITKSNGVKFGKTETGTIWLNNTKTSAFEFYQYLLNTSDSDVINLIKYLTLINEKKLNQFQKLVDNEPSKKVCQKYLAAQVTKFIHGEIGLEQSQKITNILFSGQVRNLSEKELCLFADSTKIIHLHSELNIQDLLVKTYVAKSRREAREFIISKSIIINGEIIYNQDQIFNKKNALFKKFHLIKRGKRKYFVGKY